MREIPDGSVDMVLCDLPYGVTRNHWDSQIPLDRLWTEYRRVTKENAAILLFCDGMFMAKLMVSNPDMWRYNLVWDKILSSGFLNANRMPLRRTEEIAVFYRKQPTYNPQMTVGKANHSKGNAVGKTAAEGMDIENRNYGAYTVVDNRFGLGNMKHPTNLLSFAKPHPGVSLHPTQKSASLSSWLIRTYTNPGDTVLDNCMGSGTTREVIKMLKDYGNHIQILTKGDGSRDFDLLDENDWYGITLDGITEHGTYYERVHALLGARQRGIKTWVSFEPVTDVSRFFWELECSSLFADKVKIGKLNYYPSDIDWSAFGKAAEERCRELGIDYYIKDSLRNEMERC